MAKPIPSLTKPTATIPADAMAAFVAGTSAPTEQPSTPALTAVPNVADEVQSGLPSVPDGATRQGRRPKRPSSSSNGRRLEPRASGENVRKVTVYLEAELDKRLSIQAVTQGVDRSTIIAEALSRHLGK